MHPVGIALKQGEREAEGGTQTQLVQPFPISAGCGRSCWSRQPLHGGSTYFKTILPWLVMAKNPSLPPSLPALTRPSHSYSVTLSPCNSPFQFLYLSLALFLALALSFWWVRALLSIQRGGEWGTGRERWGRVRGEVLSLEEQTQIRDRRGDVVAATKQMVSAWEEK